jgi:hypothetical protein
MAAGAAGMDTGMRLLPGGLPVLPMTCLHQAMRAGPQSIA